MKQLLKLTSIVLAIAIISACSGESKKSNNNDSVLTQIKKEQVKEDVTEFVYPMPTAFEVAKMLNRIGAGYIFSLSNSSENAEKYFTEKSKALNLGIYSADLSYASTYNQKQIAMDYLEASNKLIEELGFADAVDKDLIDKIEKVENDKDQLIDIFTNTFYDTYEYLNKIDRGSISMLILIGTYVEGLYIATHISEDTFNNIEMVKIIMDQKEPLAKLLSVVENFEDNADVKEKYELLVKLNTIYSGMEAGSISQEQLAAITNEIAVIRKGIVE